MENLNHDEKRKNAEEMVMHVEKMLSAFLNDPEISLEDKHTAVNQIMFDMVVCIRDISGKPNGSIRLWEYGHIIESMTV